MRDILAVLGARCLQEWHYGRHELLVLVVHDPVAALGNPHELGVREVAPVGKVRLLVPIGSSRKGGSSLL